LIKSRQGLQSVLEYAASFKQIIRKICILAPDEQIYLFSLGLRSDVAKREVAFRLPRELDAAIQIAYTSEQLCPFVSVTSSAPQDVRVVPDHVIPMEIGAIGQNPAIPRTPSSNAEKVEIRRNNGCYLL
jgi:hypothetical protein